MLRPRRILGIVLRQAFLYRRSFSRVLDLGCGTGRGTQALMSRYPKARLVALEDQDTSQRIGVAKGLFTVPADIDESNEEIVRMFSGTDE